MERQTKHRILGILVIIGLVVILLPLFQDGKENTVKTTLVKAPPFPDQSVPMANTASVETASANPNPAVAYQPQTVMTASATSSAEGPKTLINAPPQSQSHPAERPTMNVKSSAPQIPLAKKEIVKTALAMNKTALKAPNNKEAKEAATKKPEIIQTSEYKIIEGANAVSLLKKAHQNRHAHNKSKVTLTPIKEAKPVASVTIAKNQHEKKEAQAPFAKKQKHLANVAHKGHAPNHGPKPIVTAVNHGPKPIVTATLDDDGLIKLKSAVWVIQIGSFKNKTNALKMVNQLRANGYRAFIQQFSNAFGEHTSVFVGPENNPTAARTLADRLKNEMHIQAMVISYKPLTL